MAAVHSKAGSVSYKKYRGPAIQDFSKLKNFNTKIKKIVGLQSLGSHFTFKRSYFSTEGMRGQAPY